VSRDATAVSAALFTFPADLRGASPNHDAAPADGSARKDGNCYLRLTRGGAWSGSPNVMRSASRIVFGSDIRMQYLGLRVARTLRK
jgi:formylglycine-generating enzyme required for sulfatase activity